MLPLGVRQLLIVGDQDITLPQMQAYLAQAQAVGDAATLIEIPQAGHFEVIAPQSPAWAIVCAQILSLYQRELPPA